MNFNPRAPRGARHRQGSIVGKGFFNFNPRAPRGARLREQWFQGWLDRYFNPRAPRGARRITAPFNSPLSRFQSTCPARGTTGKDGSIGLSVDISIHVPREGHDGPEIYNDAKEIYFNPRAPRGARQGYLHTIFIAGKISIHVPREGHDPLESEFYDVGVQFQSTCPARGTTNEVGIHIL